MKDNMSTASIDGIEVLANPYNLLSHKQVVQIQNLKNQRENRKKNKDFRRQIKSKRSIGNDDISSVYNFDNDHDVRSDISNDSPRVPVPRHIDTSNVYRGVDEEFASSESGSNTATPKAPKTTRSTDDDISISKMTIDDLQKLISTSISSSLAESSNPMINKMKSKELKSRIKEMNALGIDNCSDFDIEEADLKAREMEHWRMKLTLDEKETADNCSTFIAVGADIVETICGALKFNAFETSDLSKQMSDAIASGRFNACVRKYANSGTTKWVTNPIMGFITTFLSIAIKNHLKQKVKGVISGREKSRKNPSSSESDSSSSVRSHRRRSRRNYSDSDSSTRSTSSVNSRRSRRSRKYRTSHQPPNVYNNHYWNSEKPLSDVMENSVLPRSAYKNFVNETPSQHTNIVAKQQVGNGACEHKADTSQVGTDTCEHKADTPQVGTRAHEQKTERVPITDAPAQTPIDNISNTISKFSPAVTKIANQMKSAQEIQEKKKELSEAMKSGVKLFDANQEN
jgi:hypothetical protein